MKAEMRSSQVFLGFIILLTVSYGAAAATSDSRLANLKQRRLIGRSMDVTAAPCDDFYQYACGNWDRAHFGAGSEYYESLSMLDYKANQEMSQAFNRFQLRNKPKFIKEAYYFYKSCQAVKHYKTMNYLAWLRDQDGFKWASIWTQPTSDMHFDWVKTLAKMRTYGFNDVFLQQIITSKIKDATTYVISLLKPDTYEGFQALTEENFKVIMLSLPADIKIQTFQRLWEEIEEFEQKLQELDAIEDTELESALEFEEKHLYWYRNLPLKWLKDYVKIILNQTHINDRMELYVQNVPYLKALDTLLKGYSQHFVCKYLKIRFLWYLHTSGPANFIDVSCLSNIRRLMPVAMHWQYEQLHPELREEYSSIYKIFNDIRQRFNSTVTENKRRFKSSVVKFLQDKINHMKLRLNNIPHVNTIEILSEFYKNLNFNSNFEKFYENHLKLLRFNFLAAQSNLKSFTAILDFTYLENDGTGASSSPYYLQGSNIVVVPLTLLHQPIYSARLGNIYKYSTMGFLLAHEMFHGFDDSGLSVDSNGNSVAKKFEENLSFNASYNCLLEINPDIISEKIADISGLRYAYQAYFQSYPEQASKTILLEGKEITLNKLFFLNVAQFFCGKFAEEFIQVAEHGSDRERLTDALSHFSEFAKAFNCKRYNNLYPHETCHLWR